MSTYKPKQIVEPKHVAVAAAARQLPLANHGGRVLSQVEVVPIFWGQFWSDPQQGAAIQGLESFFDFILTSSLMDLLAEYSTATTNIGHGHRRPSILIPSNPPQQVSDQDIQHALQNWIASGAVPQPGTDSLHFIYLPQGVVSTSGGQASCTDYCGYHGHINGTVFYAAEPYLDCQGCDYGNILDSLTKVSSHELCEAITDPALDAWFVDDASGNEIGDICNSNLVRLGGFLIQGEWSNRGSACLVAPPGP